MGLALSATGFEKTLRIGYGGFSFFRLEIAKAYSHKHGQLYEKLLKSCGFGVDENFSKEWDDGCDNDLDILLWHSDCDGKLTPSECTKIKKALKKLDVKYEEGFYQEFYKNFLEMLEHCSKRRVIISFY